MAYTYDDFLSYLPQQGLSEADFSPEDLALAKKNPTAGVKLMEYKVDWKNAKTDSERGLINSEANKFRMEQGGYNGGIDGNFGNSSLTPDDLPGYVAPQSSNPQAPTTQPFGAGGLPPTTQPFNTDGQTPGSFIPQAAPAPFDYGKPAPVYQPTGDYNNQYTEQQKKFMDDITNYKPFEFDAETNPQMQAYTKQYRREGNRAMQDTMGSLAAATGGMPSTAAMSAAGQANDYYMGQLGDKLPQIYESEFNKYLQEFGMLQQKAGYVNEREQVDYSRYWDGEKFNWDKFLQENDRYDADRTQAFNESEANRNQVNTNNNFNYGQFYDDITYKKDVANDEWEKEYKFKADTADAEQTKFNNAMDRWKGSIYADAETAKILGIEEGATYGGKETELALELKRAQIENVKKDTDYIGTYKPDSGGTVKTTPDEINAALERWISKTSTGADYTLLRDNNFSEDYLASLIAPKKEGNQAFDDITAKVKANSGYTMTQEEWDIIEAKGWSEENFRTAFGWEGKIGESGDSDLTWRDAYVPGILEEYGIESEDDFDKLNPYTTHVIKDEKTGLMTIAKYS